MCSTARISAAALLFLMAGPVCAIITANNSVAETAPSGFEWAYVYAHPDGSCVAVAPNWILTAAHVADYGGDGTLEIGGTHYFLKEIIYHGTADIALIRYDKVFPGYYTIHSGNALLNADVLMVGFGNTGTVHSGMFSSYYNDSASGRGNRRWGSNKISSLETWTYEVPPSFSSTGMVMKFDAGGTEAGVGTFDSGGGTFVREGGVWKLAGINTSRRMNLLQTGFDRSFAVSVPAYADWINSVIISTNDLDGDGIPNFWEQRYGTTTGLVPDQDDDGDGFSNYQEYIADTDPTDDASFLGISGFSVTTDPTVLFTGSTARQYQVFYTTNDLASSAVTWFAAHSNLVSGTGPGSSIALTHSDPKAFYRLQVTLPQ